MGRQPFLWLENGQVITQLESGVRLPKPLLCPPAVYSLLTSCWAYEPYSRPSFSQLVCSLRDILKIEEADTTHCISSISPLDPDHTEPPPKPSRVGITSPHVSHMQGTAWHVPVWENEQVDDTLQRQRREMEMDRQWLEQEEQQLDPAVRQASNTKLVEKNPADNPPPTSSAPSDVTWSRPTAELDRSDDQVYSSVMAIVRQVVQLKNEVNMLPASAYPNAVKAVGISLRSLIQHVDDVMPSLHSSVTSEIVGTKKLLNKDLGELVNKMRLAQQNSVTTLKEDCQRQMLAAAHTLALNSKNLLDAVDQARVRANLAMPMQDEDSSGD